MEESSEEERDGGECDVWRGGRCAQCDVGRGGSR